MNEGEFRSQDTRGAKSFAEKLDEVTKVAIDPGNAHANHYMRGMANGLILAQSIHNDAEPAFIEADKVTDFDYAAEAEKTCSILFKPEQVNAVEFVAMLESFVILSEAFNLRKKLFFRGKTPADVNLEMPRFSESLGARLDGATPDEVNILHGIVGVITEAGEMAELLLAFIRGTPFDAVHLLEESGDVEWYQHRILRGINATGLLRDTANIDKLHGRHGDAFNVFRDAHRDLGSERAKLETAAAPLFEHRETSDAMSSVAARTLSDPNATDREKSLAGSVLSQDEHKGPREEPAPAPVEFGPCEGDNPANPPEPGMIWHDGCWRFERKPSADIPGMDC